MANFEDFNDLYTGEQLGSEDDQEIVTAIENRLKELHTCLPGVIVSYDASTNTASVQPAIQRVFVTDGPKNLPLIEDVPVVFPGGGQWSVTFPVQPGDECVLVFSERALDVWHQNGQINAPAVYRLHDLSDAFAFVGLRNQNRKLSNIQTDGIELRSDDRSIYIKLKADGVEIKGNVTVTGSVTATADVVADSGVSQISLVNHIHPSGTPNTGKPVAGS